MRAHLPPRLAAAALLGLTLAPVLAPAFLVPPAHSAGGCDATVDKFVAPETIVIGQETTVTLRVRADCSDLQVPVHVALVIDNSVSMGGSRINDLRAGVAAFVGGLDFGASRVGLAVFHSRADILAELTDDPQVVIEASLAFFPRPGSDMTMGVRAGRQMLARARPLKADPDTLDVLVLLAGSTNDDGPDEVLAEAGLARDDGILVVTIAGGGGADRTTLEAMASGPLFFYTEGTSSRYPSLFEEVGANLTAVHVAGAELEDLLPANMEFVWGSGVPPPRVAGRQLRWRYDVWLPEGIDIVYAVEPQALGRHPTNESATARVSLDRGDPLELTFPVPYVNVVAPATPTATQAPETPVPTPTVALRPVFLPYLWNGHCRPGVQRADVALVLDTSSSMLETAADGRRKLDLAQDAASQFVDALNLPLDRAAVVAFSAGTRLLQPLTGDRGALQLALAGLHGQVALGTRIDLGLEAATAELAGPGHAPGNLPVVVLLTDGRGDAAPALAAAARARAAGLTVYTIALGTDVDAALLVAIAGDPARFHASPDGADLAAIYLDIARETGCGGPLAP